MVRRTQKYLRRSAIAKKQHNASSRRHGLIGNLLDYTQKKYKGHRTIPNFVITELQKEYDAYCKKNMKSRKFN